MSSFSPALDRYHRQRNHSPQTAGPPQVALVARHAGQRCCGSALAELKFPWRASTSTARTLRSTEPGSSHNCCRLARFITAQSVKQSETKTATSPECRKTHMSGRGDQETHVEAGVFQVNLVPLFPAEIAKQGMRGAMRFTSQTLYSISPSTFDVSTGIDISDQRCSSPVQSGLLVPHFSGPSQRRPAFFLPYRKSLTKTLQLVEPTRQLRKLTKLRTRGRISVAKTWAPEDSKTRGLTSSNAAPMLTLHRPAPILEACPGLKTGIGARDGLCSDRLGAGDGRRNGPLGRAAAAQSANSHAVARWAPETARVRS